MTILLLLILTGCNGFEVAKFIDPTFVKYVRSYQRNYTTYYDGSIVFNSMLSPGYYAVAHRRYVNGELQMDIEVQPENWKEITEIQREFLIYHELSHALYGANHDNEMLSNGCPKSIMNAYLQEDDCYERMTSYYIEELRIHLGK